MWGKISKACESTGAWVTLGSIPRDYHHFFPFLFQPLLEFSVYFQCDGDIMYIILACIVLISFVCPNIFMSWCLLVLQFYKMILRNIVPLLSSMVNRGTIYPKPVVLLTILKCFITILYQHNYKYVQYNSHIMFIWMLLLA